MNYLLQNFATMQMVLFLYLFVSYFVIFTGMFLFEVEQVQKVAKEVGEFEEAEYERKFKKRAESHDAEEVEDHGLVAAPLLFKNIINIHEELLRWV